ncbi:GIY-YIG nuclease family protein [Bacillus sp. MHSD_36]|nr:MULTISPECIES: GIY-YIG nuclease family protein [unclassified Bacillus (in: firmicutes)]MDP7990943.1 GIY-YIG nuclease family protein [Bacillus sp. MHSD_36]MDR4979817.1 GIY-YIG nuclease family protein [Bacillus sp. MHSD_37]
MESYIHRRRDSMTCGIYLIINKENRKFYIGSSNNLPNYQYFQEGVETIERASLDES